MKKLKNEENQEQQEYKHETYTVFLKVFLSTRKICDAFQGLKINNQFLGEVTVFRTKSNNFFWTWSNNTHITNENQRKKTRRSAPLTKNIHSE